MLIAHGILPDLISQLSSYSFLGIAPIIWDQTEGQFKVKKSAITCIGTVITLQLGLCLIVHDWYNRHQQSNSHVANNNGGGGGGGEDSGGGMEKAYNRIQRLSCALFLFLVAFLHGRNMRSAHALVAFLNGMIAFEQKYTGRIRLPMDWKGKLTKYFCLVVRLFNNIGPILITLLITVSETNSPLNLIEFLAPSSSSFLGSGDIVGDGNGGSGGSGGVGIGGSNDLDLSSSSSATASSSSSLSGITIITGNQMVQRFITWTITALINLIIWYMVVNIRGFWTCGQILIGCYGIRSALNLYASIMTRGKLLRITKEKIQEALIYREIQLLTSLFNEVHGNPILAILLLLSSLLQSVSLYLYVRFIATMTSSFYFVPSSWTWTSSRLFIAYMVFDGIFIVFVVFGCCAEVYITSVQVKEQLQQNEVFQRSEWFTQFFISCPTIKFKAGSTNFIAEGQLGCGSITTASSQQNTLNDPNGSGGGSSRCMATPTPSPSDSMFNMMMSTSNGNANGGGGGNNNVECSFPSAGIYSKKMAVNNNGNSYCGCGNPSHVDAGGGSSGSNGRAASPANGNSIAAMALNSGLFDM